MDKVKLAICIKDPEYQARFVNCFINHYKHQYEVHVFTNLEDLQNSKPLEFAVIITGEYTTEELTKFVERGEIILALTEQQIGEKNKEHLEHLYFTEKYQEVYKIAELLPRLVAERAGEQTVVGQIHQCKWVGVFSLSSEAYQLPFAALLAKLYGEEEQVLVLDLQCHSGLMQAETEDAHMGLEDLLSVATTGSYSKGRLLDCIGHEANWDYVYPVKNTQCLMEGTQELYKNLIDILEKEFGYQRIIINFGGLYSGQLEMMARCQSFYLLGGKEGIGYWREKAFFEELKSSGNEELLKKIQRTEISLRSGAGENWDAIADKWYWNSFGERIRQMMRKETGHGAAM